MLNRRRYMGNTGTIVPIFGVPPITTNKRKLLSLKAFGGTELLPEEYIDSVTAEGKCQQGVLPDGYTQVEYIESTGTQWIDTGFIANGGMILDAKVLPINNEMIIGSIGPNIITNPDITRNLITYTGAGVYFPQKLNQFTTTYADAGTFPAVIHFNTAGTKFYCTINGNVVVDTNTRNTLTDQTTTVKISFSDYSSTIRSGRYYYVKITAADGNVVRNLIPAKRNSDNVIGMYDTVSQTFLTNAGTGTFTAGADVVPSPDTPMDIVCNNGVVKMNRNLYSTEYRNSILSQQDGVTVTAGITINVSGMIDCRTIKSFKITTISPQGSFRIYKYGADNTFIDATSTTNVGDVVMFGDNVDFFRIQYNYSSAGTDTEDILIYDSAYNLNEIYTDGTQEVVTDSVGNTASVERLLAVGDYKDTQEILSGVVNRQIDIKVFDGTEDWAIHASGAMGWSIPHQQGDNNLFGYCSHFLGVQSSIPVGYLQIGQFKITSTSNSIYFKTEYNTVAAWKRYLADQYNAGTPVIVVYPLATPTTENVTGQLLTKSPVTYAGSIAGLTGTVVESQHTTPTPTNPLQINCNNGVVKVKHKSGLPWGYTLLDYIESTGEQYINPEISGNARWIITAQATVVKGSSQALLSSTDDASPGSWYGEFLHTGYWDIISNGTNILVTTKTTADLTFDNNGVRGTIGSTSVNRAVTVTQGTWSMLKALPNYYPFSGKLFDAKVYQNDTLVRNMIPAKRNSDNVLGMYDTVSNTFFTNQGTGNFIAGQDIDDIEIYADGETETIWGYGKNLFGGTYETLKNTYIDANGVYLPADTVNTYRYFKVLPSTTYTISGKTVRNGGMRIPEYTSNKTFIVRNVYLPNPYSDLNPKITITTTATTEYLAMSLDKDITDIQFEQGSTATTYEPYFNGGSALAEMLLKVGNYQDVQSVLDGDVTRNVGIKVFDGTENWLLSGTTLVSEIIDSNPALSYQKLLYCSHFPALVNSSETFGVNITFYSGSNGWLYVKGSGYDNDVDSWKQYLTDQYNAGTPVIIVYPLATPTTEQVAGQTLTLTKGTNIIDITQASLDNLELEVRAK